MGDLDDMHANSITVPCTYCGAIIGQPCRNRKTGEPTRIPHSHRLRDTVEVPF